MRQKFTLITLGVKDFQKALAFYEGLGWKKSQQSQEAYALFPLGGIVLGLYPLQELEKDTTLNYQQASFSGMTISYNATSEEEVDTVMQEAERLGATVVKPAQKVFWGGYSGYFKDLDGYVFEVAYNPFWEIDSLCNLFGAMTKEQTIKEKNFINKKYGITDQTLDFKTVAGKRCRSTLQICLQSEYRSHRRLAAAHEYWEQPRNHQGRVICSGDIRCCSEGDRRNNR